MATQNAGLPFDYSTASGVTRAGAEKFPNPFFDIASEYVPSDVNQIFELTEYLMMTMAPFRAVTQRVVRYFLTEVVFEGGEDDDREKYEDLFNDQLKVIDLLGEVGDDYMCFQGDTKVVTRGGVFPIRELAGRDVEVLSQGGVWRTAHFKCYGEQELMEVVFSDGRSVLATPEHRWIVKNTAGRTVRIPTTSLRHGHRIERTVAPRPSTDCEDFRAGVRHGVVFGDGTVYNKTRKTPHARAMLFGHKDVLLPFFEGVGCSPRRIVHRDGYNSVPYWSVNGLDAALKELPPPDASASYWYGFVCGFLATDGSVDTYGCPLLTQKSRKALEAIVAQLPRIGMVAGAVREYESESSIKDQDGNPRHIASTTCVVSLYKQFMRPDDFLLPAHRAKFVANYRPTKYGRFIGVSDVKPTGLREKVYCCNEPETHSFVIENGIITSNCYGNAYLSVFLPFDRYLICPECKTNYHVEAYREWKFAKGQFTGVCPKCKRKVVFGHRDLRSPDVKRVRLIRWNPKFIRLRVHPVSGRTEYYLELDRTLIEKVRSGNPFYLNDTPWSMIECALRPSDNIFKFREGSVFHLRAGSLAGLPIRGWGLPPMLPNFKLAYYIQLLRRYDEAITLDYIVPFRVLFPQAQTADGKDALSMMSMSTFVSQMKHMVDNHRKQITDVQVAPFPVGYQMLGGEGKTLSPKDSIQSAFDELYTSMGYPVELYKGSLSLQAAPVALRLFEKEQCHLVYGYGDILAWLMDITGRYFRWERRGIDVKLRPVTLADDLERKALMVQAAAGGDLSKQTAYRVMGIDYMDEQRRVIDEQQEIQRLQQKAMAESVQQPLDGSGGENAGTNAVVGAAPSDITGQASDLASKIIAIDPTQRRRILLDIKKTNPTLHALVISDLEDMRNQAASQGRQMAGQV